MRTFNIALYLVFSFLFFACEERNLEPEQKEFVTDIVVDVEGNKYTTVKIGNKWWMAEDLKSTKMRNSEPIDLVNETNRAEWASATKPKYAKGPTGFLYNYHCINSGNNTIAPPGWHVATEKDWAELEAFIGMNESDISSTNWRGLKHGDNLKESYQKRSWILRKDIWGSDDFGFTAKPCGCRIANGNFCDPFARTQGFWWTSTININEAWFRNLDYKKSQIFRATAPKTYGMAIRCVKD